MSIASDDTRPFTNASSWTTNVPTAAHVRESTAMVIAFPTPPDDVTSYSPGASTPPAARTAMVHAVRPRSERLSTAIVTPRPPSVGVNTQFVDSDEYTACPPWPIGSPSWLLHIITEVGAAGLTGSNSAAQIFGMLTWTLIVRLPWHSHV